MCPDPELLSAWLDGEVTSPWRERIAEHLDSCASCSATARRFRSLSERLRIASAPAPGFDEASTLLRIGNTVEAALAAREIERSPGVLRGSLDHWWRRRVSLSLPLVAALGAILIGFGGFGLSVAVGAGRSSVAGKSPQGPSVPVISAEMPSAAGQPANMDELLRYLESRNSEVTLTIKLPSGTSLDSSGSPVLMVAPRGTPIQGRVVNSPPQGGSP